MKKTGLLLIAMLLIVSFVAMAGAQKEGSKAPAEKVSLLAWWTVRKPIMEFSKEEVKKFETEHPNIQVELMGMPEDALQQKLIGATKANIGPDVVYIDENIVKVM